MRRIRNILMMLCLGSAFVAGAAENGRIGVVNLEKIFREYYKSRIAEDAIKQQAEVYRTYLMRLNDQLRTLKEEARAARLNSQNLALSEADRKAAVEKADAKARQVSQKEAEIELYATEGSASLRKVEQQKREAIMAEIQQEIRRRAAAEDWLSQLSVPAEEWPDFEKSACWYQSQSDNSELILFWDESAGRLYALESFL